MENNVLSRLRKIKLCKIIHEPTGLFFNGYNEYYKDTKGKNTLSFTHFKSYLANGKSDEEILNLAFEENLVVKEDGQKYLQNNIVYKGSEINKVLSEIYSNPEYIPVKHFQIIRE